LPTEAEWEFSCRAGTTTNYWTGNSDPDLAQAAWFGPNSGDRTHAVGELKANPFGLYDIHGNVYEWVQDWWDPTYYGQFQELSALDPKGPSSSATSERVIKGGRFSRPALACRASFHLACDPTYHRDSCQGFRVRLTLKAVKAAIAKRATKPASGKVGIPDSGTNPTSILDDLQKGPAHV